MLTTPISPCLGLKSSEGIRVSSYVQMESQKVSSVNIVEIFLGCTYKTDSEKMSVKVIIEFSQFCWNTIYDNCSSKDDMSTTITVYPIQRVPE